MLIPVILSGGEGQRLWPLTGPERPKSSLRLASGRTLLEETFSRAKAIASLSHHTYAKQANPKQASNKNGALTSKNSIIPIIIVTSHNFLDQTLKAWHAQFNAELCDGIANHDLVNNQFAKNHLASNQMASSQMASSQMARHEFQCHIILEPRGRDTAIAFGLANAFVTQNFGNDHHLILMPSDHIINDVDGFKQTIDQALELTKSHDPVVFGVKPISAETKFGYLGSNGDHLISFHEKPDTKTALTYFESNNYFWNSGLLLCSTSKMSALFNTHGADWYDQCVSIATTMPTTQADNVRIYRPSSSNYHHLPKGSLDYLILEKAICDKSMGCGSAKFGFVKAGFDWADVGSLDDWFVYNNKKNSKKTGSFDEFAQSNYVFSDRAHNCFIHAENKPIAAIDVEDLLIVETNNGVLVSGQRNPKNIRGVSHHFSKLKKHNYDRDIELRPWGFFKILEQHDGYKVKKLVVEPGARLSLQSHQFRHEHWFVVKGVATITNNAGEQYLKVEQSVDIAKGELHRLANYGDEVLILIEIQTGTYFGEDDEMRYADDYDRASPQRNINSFSLDKS